jgi:L-alanine-DL-glutamate epimerase-like enolase superfamily enzyme
MKVSMMPDQIGNSLEILSIVSGAGSRVAFDAHGCFSLQDLLRIDERVLDVAWLEDPFSSNDKVWSTLNRQSTPLPRLAVGEDSHATKRLRELGSLSCVFALNLEVERLGISRALEILEIMRVIGKPCFLHGRLPVTSGHMALAYSDVVAQLEVHIPFAEERLISGRWLRPGVNDPRHLITSWMAEVGACISPACTIREIWRIDWRN